MLGALGTPQNNAVLGDQLQKGVPNIFPFTAARSMAEPHHALKFAQFSTYYDQVRAATKHFVEKEGKKTRSAPCTRTRISGTRSATRCAIRPRPARSRLLREASYGPTDTEFMAPVTKLKIGRLRSGDHGLHHPATASRRSAPRGSSAGPTWPSSARRRPTIRSWRRRPAASWKASTPAPACPMPIPTPAASRSRPGPPSTRPGPAGSQQRRAVRLRGRRHRRQGAGGRRQGPDARQVPAALESVKDYRPIFPGPTLSYGAKQHQGSTATFLAKVEGGRWKVVAENLLY